MASRSLSKSSGKQAASPLMVRLDPRSKQFLADAGIPVVARDVGAAFTRKLVYHLHTGEAFVRRIKAQRAAVGNGRA